MAENIAIIRGTSNLFEVELTDADGVPYNLQPGDFVVFGVKKKRRDNNLVLQKIVKSGENGIYKIKLSPSDTSELEYGDYFYDVGVQIGADFYNVIEPGAFTIDTNVTKWGADE